LSMDDREKSFEQYKRLIKSFADPCKGIIYHYTSAEGFRGIVERNEIWLTNTEFVNDPTECKALQTERDLFSEGELTNDLVKHAWDEFIKSPRGDNNTYIASFCSGEESLEQWRAYGNFCIGFEAKKLVKNRFNLYQCVYHKEEIKQWILDKEKLRECVDFHPLEKGGAAYYIIMAGYHLIFAASKKYKNESYEYEREIRLIAISNSFHTLKQFPDNRAMFEDDPPIHFRKHSCLDVPVPYVKFFIDEKEVQENREETAEETPRQMKESKLRREKNKKRVLLPIKEILIGPMPYQQEAKIACEILLCEKGYENVEVKASSIPYRGF